MSEPAVEAREGCESLKSSNEMKHQSDWKTYGMLTTKAVTPAEKMTDASEKGGKQESGRNRACVQRLLASPPALNAHASYDL
jgi:hypothetical protein